MKERKPSTSLEGSKLADDYVQARGASVGSTMSLKITGMKLAVGIVSNKKSYICKKSYHLAKDCPRKMARTGKISKPDINLPRCFVCQRSGMWQRTFC